MRQNEQKKRCKSHNLFFFFFFLIATIDNCNLIRAEGGGLWEAAVMRS